MIYNVSTQLEVDALPRVLNDGIRAAQTAQQADMLLLSLITASGYAMPNYYVRHGQPAHRYSPSLMTLVVAPPASGKGIMNLSKRLIQPIHERLRQDAQRDALLAQLEEREPRELMAFLPANCSNNAFLKLLNDNAGRAIMVETEMDVVTGIWKQDYGNYSAMFRQAFEHEAITKARKTKGDGYLEIPSPCLSVILSGTANQLEPLLRSRENGLASRFICYKCDEIIPFAEEAILTPEEKQSDETNVIYARQGQTMLRMQDWLSEQKHDCEFALTAEQAKMMRNYFHDGYLLTLGDMQLPTTFDPVVKRLAVSSLRIGMILTMLRYFDEEVMPRLDKGETVVLPNTLTCEDTDFGTMMLLTDALLCHAIDVHEMLPTEDTRYIEPLDDPSSKPLGEALALLSALPKQFTTKEAKDLGKQRSMSPRSIDNYLSVLLENKQIGRMSKGHFVKLN